MKNRRSFLRKLGAIVAVIALAPEICFKHHFPAPKSTEPLNLQELFNQFYAIKRERENAGNADTIEIWISGEAKEKTRKLFKSIFDNYGGVA